MIHISNYKNFKLAPILIRYFDAKTVVQMKVLELTNLNEDNLDKMLSYIIEVSTKYKLSQKISVFLGDIFNSNFEDAARKGTKNVFFILKNN